MWKSVTVTGASVVSLYWQSFNTELITTKIIQFILFHFLSQKCFLLVWKSVSRQVPQLLPSINHLVSILMVLSSVLIGTWAMNLKKIGCTVVCFQLFILNELSVARDCWVYRCLQVYPLLEEQTSFEILRVSWRYIKKQ